MIIYGSPFNSFQQQKHMENIDLQHRDREQQQPNQPLHQPHTFHYHQLISQPLTPEPLPFPHHIQPQSQTISLQQNQLLQRRRIVCCLCQREINKTVSILCSDKYRCVGCFSKEQDDVESYKVIKSLNFSLIDTSWRADHQLLLLDSMQKYGFGNWKEIKQQMELQGANFQLQELKDHYQNYYLSNEAFLPFFPPQDKTYPNNESFFLKKEEPINKISNFKEVNQSSKASSAQRTTTQLIDIEDYCQKDRGYLQYYNQKRNQFQVQYDNQAQLALANLQFREDDEQAEKAFKFQIINRYNKRVARRNKIKQFVLEHRLLEEDYQQQAHSNRNQYQRIAFQNLKPIARYMTLKEFNSLVAKVAFTSQIKATIEGFRDIRRSHPNNYKNIQQFMNHQSQDSKPKKKIHSNQGSFNKKKKQKVQQVMEQQFKMSKKDLDQLLSILHRDGKRGSYKNVEAVIVQKRLDQ